MDNTAFMSFIFELLYEIEFTDSLFIIVNFNTNLKKNILLRISNMYTVM